MTENDYDPSGTTALLDAIGGAIRHVSNIHKYARPEDVPSSTVFVITTDGMENSSKEYSRHEVKRMIEEKTESHGWEFIFVAANIDEVETARSFGIRKERAAKYSHDGDGVLACYRAMNEFVSMKRDRVISDSDETWKLGLD
jgi:aspartyl aminopeptidase